MIGEKKFIFSCFIERWFADKCNIMVQRLLSIKIISTFSHVFVHKNSRPFNYVKANLVFPSSFPEAIRLQDQ